MKKGRGAKKKSYKVLWTSSPDPHFFFFCLKLLSLNIDADKENIKVGVLTHIDANFFFSTNRMLNRYYLLFGGRHESRFSLSLSLGTSSAWT